MVCFCLIGSLAFGDVAAPRKAKEAQTLEVPSTFNESLGFGKIYYVSLPSYIRHSLVLICRRTDRQDHMSLTFYVSGLTAEVTQFVNFRSWFNG